MLKIFSQDKAAFGLDISDVSLKLIQFSGANRDILAYSDDVLPKDIVSADNIKDPKALAVVIKKAVSHPKFGKVTTPYVVASIPETKCFVRVISMPAMSEQEAREAVPWEAEAYIPIPIGQVYLDWTILPVPIKYNKMTVLITAAPKDYIDNFTKVLKQAGLAPLALEVESQATARSLVADSKETVLILDIDTARASFIIYDAGTLQFTSSIPIAGNVFTESIARSLGVSSEEAEKLKRENGLDESKDEGKVRKALISILSNLVTEIKNTIRFYEEHSPAEKKISRILLSGSSSKLKHLPSFLAEMIAAGTDEHPLRSASGLKVELGDPWAKILQKRQVAPISREDSLSYATAVGLALREDIKDEDPRVRAQAAASIGEYGEKAADVVPELIELLNDSSLSVRFSTRLALAKIKTPEALEALKKNKKGVAAESGTV